MGNYSILETSVPPLSTSSPKPSENELSFNVTDTGSVTSRGSRGVDVSKISRLLDHLTFDDDGLCEYDDIDSYNPDDICFYPVNEATQNNADDKGMLLILYYLFLY